MSPELIPKRPRRTVPFQPFSTERDTRKNEPRPLVRTTYTQTRHCIAGSRKGPGSRSSKGSAPRPLHLAARTSVPSPLPPRGSPRRGACDPPLPWQSAPPLFTRLREHTRDRLREARVLGAHLVRAWAKVRARVRVRVRARLGLGLGLGLGFGLGLGLGLGLGVGLGLGLGLGLGCDADQQRLRRNLHRRAA